MVAPKLEFIERDPSMRPALCSNFARFLLGWFRLHVGMETDTPIAAFLFPDRRSIEFPRHVMASRRALNRDPVSQKRNIFVDKHHIDLAKRIRLKIQRTDFSPFFVLGIDAGRVDAAKIGG